MPETQECVKCPICKSQLTVEKELFDSKLLSCPICHCDFKNPIETKRFKKKLIWIILAIFIALWIIGKIAMEFDANDAKVYEQGDRTEIYYHDENGNIIKRETIYKDDRPTEVKYY